MKNLLLWNDLNLFFPDISLVDIDKQLTNLISFFNNKYKTVCQYQFISSREKLWKVNIEDKDITFSVGTRPKIILQNMGIQNYYPLKMSRIREDDGTNVKVLIENEDFLVKIARKAEIITVFEDIIVEGNSMKKLCLFLLNNFCEENINIHVWYGNSLAVNKLREMFPNINFYIGQYFEGVPIVDSTFICLYDILYEKIGGCSFLENELLLSNFFFDDVRKLQKEMNFIKEELEKYGKAITQNKSLN